MSVLQCVRQDDIVSPIKGSVRMQCDSCRGVIIVSRVGVEYAREGARFVCNRCKPAKDVGLVTPG